MGTTIFATNHELKRAHIEKCMEAFLNSCDKEKFKKDLNSAQWKFSDKVIEQVLRKYNLTK